MYFERNVAKRRVCMWERACRLLCVRNGRLLQCQGRLGSTVECAMMIASICTGNGVGEAGVAFNYHHGARVATRFRSGFRDVSPCAMSAGMGISGVGRTLVSLREDVHTENRIHALNRRQRCVMGTLNA